MAGHKSCCLKFGIAGVAGDKAAGLLGSGSGVNLEVSVFNCWVLFLIAGFFGKEFHEPFLERRLQTEGGVLRVGLTGTRSVSWSVMPRAYRYGLHPDSMGCPGLIRYLWQTLNSNRLHSGDDSCIGCSRVDQCWASCNWWGPRFCCAG